MPIQPSEALKNVDLFAQLPKQSLNDLGALGNTKSYEGGEVIVQQGESSPGLHVILVGSAEARVNGVPRATLYPDDYFGELTLIDSAPVSATIVAGPDGMEALVLKRSTGLANLLASPDISQALVEALCARLRDLEFNDVTWAFKGIRFPVRGIGDAAKRTSD